MNLKKPNKSMRRNSNYFADVSQFFLKAKRREQIELDPEIKSRIRGSIELKINDLKFRPEEPAHAVEKPTEPALNPAPKQSFWRTWRYQFIGVPASLFALMLIVFAANNFKFTLPASQDFAPASDDYIVEEKPLIAEIITETQPEKKPKPELLILDINDLGQRNLNQLPAAEPAAEPVKQPSAQQTISVQTKEDADTKKTTQSTTEPDTAITQTPTIKTTDTTTKPPATVTDEALITSSDDLRTQPEAEVQPEPQQLISADTADDTTESEIKTIETTKTLAPTASTTSLLENNNELFKISYYGTSLSAQEPDFDKAILDTLISDKSPSAVKVYYTDETHVTVEVTLEKITKYYTYEKKDLEWTITKFWSRR